MEPSDAPRTPGIINKGTFITTDNRLHYHVPVKQSCAVLPLLQTGPSVSRKCLIHRVCSSRNRCRGVSAGHAFGLEDNSWVRAVRRQEVWQDSIRHPLPSAELVFLPLTQVLDPVLYLLTFFPSVYPAPLK